MAAIVERVEISRRPEDVFTYVLEPLYYREWDDSVVSAHREDPFARPRARRALPRQLKKLKEILDGGGVIADGRQKPSARA